MNNTDVVTIQVSKLKLLMLFVGSLGFVGMGTWFVISPSTFAERYSPMFITTMGFVSIAFFGVCGLSMLVKLFGNKPGLIIDKDGVTDNSGGASVGFIPWSDIVGISKSVVVNQNFVMISVVNREEYILRQTNLFKKLIIKANNSSYGSPISISANSLKCTFNELYTLLMENFGRYASKENIV